MNLSEIIQLIVLLETLTSFISDCEKDFNKLTTSTTTKQDRHFGIKDIQHHNVLGNYKLQQQC